MTIDKIVALILATGVLCGPALLSLVESLLRSAPKKTSYIAAVENLGIVRSRLVQTECLGEAQKAAIDALTLALVSGSEK